MSFSLKNSTSFDGFKPLGLSTLTET